jgi:hypothetical protein
MDFIGVTAQFSPDGNITPLSFTWQGRDYPVESVGRSWQDTAGHHFLVIVPGARIFELVLDLAASRWRLEQVGTERQVA